MTRQPLCRHAARKEANAQATHINDIQRRFPRDERIPDDRAILSRFCVLLLHCFVDGVELSVKIFGFAEQTLLILVHLVGKEEEKGELV